MIRYRDFCDKDSLRNTVIQELRKLGYKHAQKLRKNSQKTDQGKQIPHISCGRKLFHTELHLLASKIVNLETGDSVNIPTFVADACTYIEENVSTEGIFRKGGSAARQREIKALLEEGNDLGPTYHVIDVANILKLFFRELPEPLIPFHCHEILVWSLQMKEKMTDCFLLACLLLPNVHLDTLIYFMQFLQRVADHADLNKMDVSNLAIIMAPTLMPVEEKKTENMSQNGFRLKNHVKIIELLIKSSKILGEVPTNLEKKLSVLVQRTTGQRPSRSSGRQDDGIAKKKRRSGSLTRVLTGLRRMVGKAPSPGCSGQHISHKMQDSYDHSLPCHSNGKKRKALESSVSFNAKKKLNDLQSLPSRSYFSNSHHMPFQQDILMPSIACGPCASPKVCFDPNISPEPSEAKSFDCEIGQKPCLIGYQKMGKKQKVEENKNYKSKLSTKGDKVQLNPVRRWSSVTTSRKSKIHETQLNSYPSRNVEPSLLIKQNLEVGKNNSSNDNERRMIDSEECFERSLELNSRSFLMANLEKEYEKIKNKVSAIESQLIEEFGRLGATVEGNACNVASNANDASKGLELVQTKYEKTLEEAERFSDSSADHLAKRLSRELKIRRSSEHKIIRSPSARKIGSLRRRSKDSFKQQKMPINSDDCSSKNNSETVELALSSKQGLLNASVNSGTDCSYFQSSLKRGRPNTVHTGLRQPSPALNVDTDPGTSSRIQLTFVNAESFPSNSVHMIVNTQKSHTMKSQSLVENSPGLPNSGSVSGEECNISNRSKPRKLGSFDFATPDILEYKSSDKLVYSNSTPMSQLRRTASFHTMDAAGAKCNVSSNNDFKKCSSYGSVSQGNVCHPVANLSPHSSNEHWHSARAYLSDQNLSGQPVTGRESIAKLRAQNAGKVLANVKLFEHNGQEKDGKMVSLCGTSQIERRQSVNSKRKSVGEVRSDLEPSKCLHNVKTSKFQISSHGVKLSPKMTSLSDSESPHGSSRRFKRSQEWRLSAPDSQGSHSQRYRKSSGHKKNVSVIPGQVLEHCKENYIISSQGFTENCSRGNNDLKEDECTPLSEKIQCSHSLPLKDRNRMLVKKVSPAYDISSASEICSNENSFVSVTAVGNFTPYVTKSPLIKQPLTSGHSSLRPISRLRRNAKASPVRGIHKVFGEGTPKLTTPRRQSPRLLLRSRLMSNACM